MEGYRKSFLYYNKSGECLRESVEGYRKSGGSLRESGEGFRKSVWGYHQSAFDLEPFDLNREQIDLMT